MYIDSIKYHNIDIKQAEDGLDERGYTKHHDHVHDHHDQNHYGHLNDQNNHNQFNDHDCHEQSVEKFRLYQVDEAI